MIPFGVNQEPENGFNVKEQRLGDTFFKNGGHLSVIAVPYIEGRHYPSTFAAIVDYLKQMHGDGHVHGDIRLMNMVFGKTSQLIDFDFSGPVGDTFCPKRYKSNVFDGEGRQDPHDYDVIKPEEDAIVLPLLLGSRVLLTSGNPEIQAKLFTLVFGQVPDIRIREKCFNLLEEARSHRAADTITVTVRPGIVQKLEENSIMATRKEGTKQGNAVTP